MASTLLTTTSSAKGSLSPSVGDTYYETDTGRLILCKSVGPVAWVTYASSGVAYNTGGAAELQYPTGLWSDPFAQFYLTDSPVMHFDARILDGTAAINNPAAPATIGSWADRSGYAPNGAPGHHDLSALGALQPMFTVSGAIQGVTFDGADYFNLANSFTVMPTSNLTQIIVHTNSPNVTNSISGLSPTSHTNANSLFVTGGGNGGDLHIGGSSAGLGAPPTFSLNSPNLHILTKAATNFNYWWQGGAAHYANATRTLTNTFTKMFTTYNTVGINSTVHEVIVFDKALDVIQLNKIVDYVNLRYSLTIPTIS